MLTANAPTWKMCSPVSPEETKALMNAVTGLQPVVAQVLLQRGLNTFESVSKFMAPDLDSLDDYGVMKGCSKAAARLKRAIENKEKILVYGDYDVDGTCSVSAMYLFLHSLNANVETYIPDRYQEGYGVSATGVNYAIASKFDLMITLDCGISAVSELGRASAAGIDVIVCDHHIPGEKIPDVFAVLNPMQPDCPFTGKVLCGCGVALMLLRAVSEAIGRPDKWKDYLALTAIATCCDIVPLTGINRVLTYYGIAAFNAGRSVGLDALLNQAGKRVPFGVSDIVFQIGPRINAAGRLDHANLVIELLTTTEPEKASELAAQIENLNKQRRDLDKNTTDEAIRMLKNTDAELKLSSTVVFNDSWHKGVVGIVASRLIEFCYRPTVVLTRQEGLLTGSARSIEGIHLYDALKTCGHLLTKFGGHTAAAGLTLEEEKLEAFTKTFDDAIREATGGIRSQPELYIDLEVDFKDWHTDKSGIFIKQLDRLRPFGPGNLQPVFATKNCIASYPSLVGKDHSTLRFKVHQVGDERRKVACVAFRQADAFEKLALGKPFRMAYTIDQNIWIPKNNDGSDKDPVITTQLTVQDIVFTDD